MTSAQLVDEVEVMTALPNWDIHGPVSSDADLARAAAAGDRRAFAGIYDRYADRLHDFCIGMLRDREGAADCVQDAFCIAATQLPKLRDPDRLRPWLYSIARNEALRRIRERRRETPSDDLPDGASADPGPETLAARMELADLIADAAGGLSDRDRSVLELAFRHGLSGPDLAEALGVTPSNANTIVHRLRETIERSLGALLVARRVRNTRDCGELAAILDGWDGHFNVLMRKRISRHIDSCDVCEQERRRLASPVALLGAAPVLVPAPAWLRERTLSEIQLTSAGSALPVDREDAKAAAERNTHGYLLPIALFVGALAGVAALMFVWLNQQSVPTPTKVSTTVTAPVPPPPPSAPAPPPPVSVTTAPAPIAPPPSARVQPAAPTVPPTAPPSSEPPPPPVVEPTVVAPPPPPPPPLPDWPDWLPEWPDPPPPPPGGDLTGPGDLVAPGGDSTPGGSAVP